MTVVFFLEPHPPIQMLVQVSQELRVYDGDLSNIMMSGPCLLFDILIYLVEEGPSHRFFKKAPKMTYGKVRIT